MQQNTGPAKAQDLSRWQLADLVDLEYLLEQDEQASRANQEQRDLLAERDRDIYLASENRQQEHKHKLSPTQERRGTIRAWLEKRRLTFGQTHGFLPGAVLQQSWNIVAWLLILCGLVSGWVLATTLLHFDGHRPVSVAWFCLIMIGMQLVMLLFTLCGLLWRHWKGRKGHAVGPGLVGRILERIVLWFSERLLLRKSQKSTGSLPTWTMTASLLRQHSNVYGSLLWLPLAQLAQLFGVAFNVAAVITTVMLVLFSDIAFGWSSTTPVSAETVYTVVRYLAMPWSWWLGEGYGYPSLAQVAGSRVYLEQWAGVRAGMPFDPQVLRSWSWFLVFSLLCYGLLPRVVLLLLGQWFIRHKLSTLSFSQARCQALYARMKAPRVSITPQATEQQGVEMPIPEPLPISQNHHHPEHSTQALQVLKSKPLQTIERLDKPVEKTSSGLFQKREQETIVADACLLLVHTDINALLDAQGQQKLDELVTTLSTWQVAKTEVFGHAVRTDHELIARIGQISWKQPPARIVVVNDGSEPPITEHLLFLRQLRAAVDEQAMILLALTGDPEGDDLFPPLSQFDYTDWQQKISQLADPWLRLDTLVGLKN